MTWGGGIDSEGNREYKIAHKVKGTVSDGPANALRAIGLPSIGSRWAFGADLDIWAWCQPQQTATILQEKEGDPNRWWRVENTFSTKSTRNYCKDQRIENPLLEPQQLSGGATNSAKDQEATLDRFGRPIMNSAWEPFKGEVIKFDRSIPTVKVQQNVSVLNAALCYNMMDCVNDRVMWGQPRRTVKLKSFSWERKFYGLCFKYYTRTFEFEIDGLTFDRDILDEGTKCLNGHWNRTTGEWVLDNIAGQPPNSGNPHHFIRFKDRNNENCRVILNGAGLPAYTVASYDKAGLTYLCFNNGTTGIKVNDTAHWIAISGPYLPTKQYQDEVIYPVGSIVKTGIGITETFVALERVLNVTPPAQEWRVINAPLNVRGVGYDDNEVYNEGDILTITKKLSAPTIAGYIHVEKYPEVNFLLLGIPLIL